MAELATIARPYAEALFKASASDLDGTAGWLDQERLFPDSVRGRRAKGAAYATH